MAKHTDEGVSLPVNHAAGMFHSLHAINRPTLQESISAGPGWRRAKSLNGRDKHCCKHRDAGFEKAYRTAVPQDFSALSKGAPAGGQAGERAAPGSSSAASRYALCEKEPGAVLPGSRRRFMSPWAEVDPCTRRCRHRNPSGVVRGFEGEACKSPARCRRTVVRWSAAGASNRICPVRVAARSPLVMIAALATVYGRAWGCLDGL